MTRGALATRRRRALLLCLLTGMAGAAAGSTGRSVLGIFDGWGAFSEPSPTRCFAIARPLRAGREAVGTAGGAFASITTWPDRDIHNQFHVRLSHLRDPRARVTLSVGERRFDLVADAINGWTADVRTDRAVVSAFRTSRSMSVETVSRGGAPFADVYPLRGAATAIDAAGLGCARRRQPSGTQS